MDTNSNVLISLEPVEDDDKTTETSGAIEIDTTTQVPEPYTLVNLGPDGNAGPGESSTDPEVTSDHLQQNVESTNSTSGSAQDSTQAALPGYTSWHGVDAYRPIPGAADLSDRPPIPPGIPPPPYQGLHLGPIPVDELQSFSDEPPPEYPGPPQGHNPPDHATLTQFPPGSRLAQALEMERRREIGRLVVLSAVINACDERSNRNQPGARNVNLRRPRQCTRDLAAKSRRSRVTGIMLGLGVMVLVFTVIGIVMRKQKSSDPDYTDRWNSNYNHVNIKMTTTMKPFSSCSTHYCLNGGRCDDFRFTEARCLCPSAYYGSHCQYNKYAGVWRTTTRPGVWRTTTSPGVRRTTTRRPTSHPRWLARRCIFNMCLNDGSCSQIDDYSYCLCPTNYSGSYCQYRTGDYQQSTTPASPLNQGCDSSWCANGGTCWFSAVAGKNCICSANFTGYRCREKSPITK